MQIIRDGHSVRIIVGPQEEDLLCKMAAAPAMYEALESVVDLLETVEPRAKNTIASARAALRLARGEKNDG